MELVIVAAIAIVQFLIFDGVVAAPPPPTVAAAAPLAAVSTTHSTAIDADILSNPVLGDTYVHNNCPFNVFSKIVIGAKPGQPTKEDVCHVMLPGAVLKYSTTKEAEAGIEWTLMKADVEQPRPLQLNWLWRTGVGKIAWNLKLGDEQKIPGFRWRNITYPDAKRFWTNGYGSHDFEEHGLLVTPFIDHFPLKEDLCMPFGCLARSTLQFCVWKYERKGDWDKEKECPERVNFKINLCTPPTDNF